MKQRLRLRGVAPVLALVAAWGLMSALHPRAPFPQDIQLYRGYAAAVLDGVLPYRGFFFEYPPFAIVPMVVAGAVGTDITTFSRAFEIVMLASMLAVQRWGAELCGQGRRREAAAWALAAMPLLIGPLARERLDLFPTALAVVGLALISRGLSRDVALSRPVVAGMVLLGLGAAAKLFPAIAAAAVIAWLEGGGHRGLALRAAGVFVTAGVVVCAPAALLGPSGFRETMAFQAERPVQIESTPALVLRIIGGSRVSGTPSDPTRYRSQALEGGRARVVGRAFLVAQATALAGMVVWTFLAARRALPLDELAAAVLLGVLAWIALGKVLSPQFVIWVVPFVPVAWVTGRRTAAAQLVIAAVLTQWEYPRHYADVVAGSGTGMAIVAARNLALLTALALLVVGGRRRMAQERRS